MKRGIIQFMYDSSFKIYNKTCFIVLQFLLWSILKSNLPVLMSWGVEIETVKVITCGLEFRVNGFKHTGKVQIVLNEDTDLFEVCLIGEDGEIREKREDIYFDMLVFVVDELVEKTDDYEKRVSDTYNIIKY